MDHNFSQEDIAEMDIKDLNRIIKANKLTDEDSKSVKDARRKMKMRAYGVKNRQRKKDEYQALQRQRQCLVMELGELQQEVHRLQEMKNQFVYQSDSRSDDEDDENVEIC